MDPVKILSIQKHSGCCCKFVFWPKLLFGYNPLDSRFSLIFCFILVYVFFVTWTQLQLYCLKLERPVFCLFVFFFHIFGPFTKDTFGKISDCFTFRKESISKPCKRCCCLRAGPGRVVPWFHPNMLHQRKVQSWFHQTRESASSFWGFNQISTVVVSSYTTMRKPFKIIMCFNFFAWGFCIATCGKM